MDNRKALETKICRMFYLFEWSFYPILQLLFQGSRSRLQRPEGRLEALELLQVAPVALVVQELLQFAPVALEGRLEVLVVRGFLQVVPVALEGRLEMLVVRGFLQVAPVALVVQGLGLVYFELNFRQPYLF
jgi:hypothetical protein